MARPEINAAQKQIVTAAVISRIMDSSSPALIASFYDELNNDAWANAYVFVKRIAQQLPAAGLTVKTVVGTGTYAFHRDFELPKNDTEKVSYKRLMTKAEIHQIFDGICNTAIEAGYTLAMTDIYNEIGKEAFDHQGNFVASFGRWLEKQQKGGLYPSLILDGKRVIGSFLGTDRAEIESYLTAPEPAEHGISREQSAADKAEIVERIVLHVLTAAAIVDMAELFKDELYNNVNDHRLSKSIVSWRSMFVPLLINDPRITVAQRRGVGTFLAPAGTEIKLDAASAEPQQRGRKAGLRYAWQHADTGKISYKGERSTPDLDNLEWEKLPAIPVFLQRSERDVSAVYKTTGADNVCRYATLCINGDIYIYSPV